MAEEDNGPETPGESAPASEAGPSDTPVEDGGRAPGGRDMGFEELQASADTADEDDEEEQRTAHDLEPVFDVPVKVQAVLGRSSLEVSQLLKLAPGAVLELDRKIGEAIDIYVNNRLVARGEVVLVEDHLGVTMTEIIKTERI